MLLPEPTGTMLNSISISSSLVSGVTNVSPEKRISEKRQK
jgi:hypothetical protein